MTDLRGINRLAGRLGTSYCESLFSSCFVSSAITSGVLSSILVPSATRLKMSLTSSSGRTKKFEFFH